MNMSQLVKNISTVKMFQSNIILSTLLFICFISDPFLIEAAPGAGPETEKHEIGPSAIKIKDRDSVINQDVFETTLKSDDDESVSGDVLDDVATEATSTIADVEDTTIATEVTSPTQPLRFRNVFSVPLSALASDLCEQGQKKDRKGRCRTVINSAA